VCWPKVNVDVVKVATPLLRGTVAKVVEPSLKSTVPVGVPPPETPPATVAIKVTGAFAVPGAGELGFGDTVSVVVVPGVVSALTV
jgi:hypothetical protein